MSEITIVTAFFDIGRKNIKGFERDWEKYVTYFSFWARIKNNLIVYTEPNMAEKVRKIRTDFGLADSTKIIIVDNFLEIEDDIYKKMEKALNRKEVIEYRKHPNYPESHNAKYNYITYLKPKFVYDAVKKFNLKGMISWMDFGYNHGGVLYDRPEDFSFLWQYDFSQKIHLFSIKKLNNLPVFNIVKKMPVDMTAGIIVAPAEQWESLYNSFRESILSLLNCDFVDDDQTLLIMSYRREPSAFEIHLIEDWFMVLKKFGGSKLHVSDKMQKKIVYKRLKMEMLEALDNKEYLKLLMFFIKYSKSKISYKYSK